MKIESKERLWNALMDLGQLCGCHQKPERSFFVHRFQVPFCSRCLGIIVGEFLIAPLLLLLKIDITPYWLLMFVPLVIDGTLQHFTRYESKNYRRFITGFLAGTAFVMLLIYLIKFIFR